ncbi:MAG: hypothetical protein PHR16_08435 [Methylovulum sp.]|nr:hypothetical protein [Methylovulum sp.]
MRTINLALLKLSKRAETYKRSHLIDSFVDIGALFTLLSNPDNQILFGRRGTGKTHVLSYLANELSLKGSIVVQLDMRMIGSTGGIYSDSRLPISERATRLLVDTLCAIHDQVLNEVIEKGEEYNLAILGPLLDKFIDASTKVEVDGLVQVEESSLQQQNFKEQFDTGISADLTSLNASLKASTEQVGHTSEEKRTSREGKERFRVHFSSVGNELEKVVKVLPGSKLWIIFDEWSEIPLDLQPYLADLLRRTVLPIRGVSVKIAAIEQRCRFRIPDSDIGHIGIEVGADAAASINLDEFLVFENNTDLAKRFFSDLLYKHVAAIEKETNEVVMPSSSIQFINETFTQQPAFEEFVRAAEGVPRDAINIIGIAAQKSMDNKISVPDIRAAARTWYSRAKQQAVTAKPNAQNLLSWIIDEVIGHRQARAFLLATDVQDELIDYLYDERILHLIKQGISAQDVPGKRFNVYSLDYGCYVDLINTSRAPKGLFSAETELGEQYIDVPQTDLRSIRRAILDVDLFYAGTPAS